MTQNLKFVALAILGVWSLAFTGCEDAARKAELRSCKQESADLRKETAAGLYENEQLKMQLADAQSSIHSLTDVNNDLKKRIVEGVATTKNVATEAKPQASRSKHETTKGKHKKRGRS